MKIKLSEQNYNGNKYGKLLVLKKIRIKNKCHPYFECQCDCGKIVRADLYKVLSGRVKSCGCLSRKGMPCPWKLGKFGESTFNSVYCDYKNNSKRRKINFSLSKEDARVLFLGNCYYCGDAPSNIEKSLFNNGDFIYSGIDRKNNNLGYIKENCVSCCKKCNFLKSNDNEPDFLDWVCLVFNELNSKK